MADVIRDLEDRWRAACLFRDAERAAYLAAQEIASRALTDWREACARADDIYELLRLAREKEKP